MNKECQLHLLGLAKLPVSTIQLPGEHSGLGHCTLLALRGKAELSTTMRYATWLNR